MNLKFLCMELSGTGGTETVLVKVLNQLCKYHKVELILTRSEERRVGKECRQRFI